MTPAQMETFRQANDVRAGHEWDKFEGLRLPARELQAFLDKVPFAAAGERRLQAPEIDVPEDLATPQQAVNSTQTGFGMILNEMGRDDKRIRQPHRHHIARRDRLHQSRRLGQPSRAVRARGDGRYVQERAHPLHLHLGILAQGPAHRARHCRDEPVHHAVGARPVALDQRRAPVADRHALRSIHRARSRCAQLRLLPGRPLHCGGDAVRHHARRRRRRASIDCRAADRAWRRTGWRRSSRPMSTSWRSFCAGPSPTCRKSGEARCPRSKTWLRDETGGSVYLRLSTRPIEQIERKMTDDLRQQIVDGAYWLREPGRTHR